MASKSTISVIFKVEDANGGFKELAMDADGLRKIMEQNAFLPVAQCASISPEE